MQVDRCYDATKINEVLNDPSIRPDVADLADGPIDVSKIIENHDNLCLMGEHGGVMLFRVQPGVYEVHTQIRPAGRGKWAVKFIRAAQRYLFTHTDAFEVMTRIPRAHIGARSLAIISGMTLEFSVDDGCRWRGDVQPCDIYSFRIQDWIKRADELIEIGQWFHDRLFSEAQRLGVTDPPHEDDPVHDRYVGASVEMARAGQIEKCVNFYNRWCIAARHQMITLVSRDPPTIHMDLGLLTFRNGDIEVQRQT